MKVRDLVFDLDGTLIDSAPSILASMQAAFDEAGIAPAAPLTPSLIGPPLAQTLRALLPDAQAHALPGLVERFKRHYDAAGYRQAAVYPGVVAMLQALARLPLRLHIATNKRIAPTRLIVAHLGWGSFFTGVHALDSFTPALPHKTAMLQRVTEALGGELLYVGDRAEDAEAAQASGIPFYWAAWGYGGVTMPVPPERELRAPAQLVAALREL